jgi:hypothetical protein
MTGVSGNKLQTYCLSEEQWQLAADVQEVYFYLFVLIFY